MAHLWIEEQPGDWAVLPLEQATVALAGLGASSQDGNRERSPAPRRAPATVMRHPDRPRATWYLLAEAGCDVWINGIPLAGGLRLLADRDQIRTGGDAPVFFSTEMLARVDGMPVMDRVMVCPRCRQPIDTGSAAVRCPACALWHHQSDTLPCWTYSPHCTLCPQPTALDAGFQWTPHSI